MIKRKSGVRCQNAMSWMEKNSTVVATCEQLPSKLHLAIWIEIYKKKNRKTTKSI